MARNQPFIDQRNEKIEKRYDALCVKYPQWKDAAIYGLLEKEFFLTSRTLYSILSGEYSRNKAKREKQKKTM